MTPRFTVAWVATLQGSIVMMLGPGTLAAIMTHKKQNNHHKYCTHMHIKVRSAQNKLRECTLYMEMPCFDLIMLVLFKMIPLFYNSWNQIPSMPLLFGTPPPFF